MESLLLAIVSALGIIVIVTIFLLIKQTKKEKTLPEPVVPDVVETKQAPLPPEINNSDEGQKEPLPPSSSTIRGEESDTDSESSKEPVRKARARPKWMKDEDAPNCLRCNSEFTFVNRRHHCRVCRKIFCGSCSSKEINNHRACENCYSDFKRKQQQRKSLERSRSKKSHGARGETQRKSSGSGSDRPMNVNVNMNINFNNVGQWYKSSVATDGVIEADEKLFEWAKQVSRKEGIMIIPTSNSPPSPTSPSSASLPPSSSTSAASTSSSSSSSTSS